MSSKIRRIWEWVLILTFSGYLYVCLELLCRGRSDITMMFCASICSIPMFALNEWFSYEMYFIVQIIICTLFCTLIELLFGLAFNMDYHIWDYRNMPGNIMGLICPQFMLVWAGISAVVIPLLDFIDYFVFKQGELPHYRITNRFTIWMKDYNERG